MVARKCGARAAVESFRESNHAGSHRRCRSALDGLRDLGSRCNAASVDVAHQERKETTAAGCRREPKPVATTQFAEAVRTLRLADARVRCATVPRVFCARDLACADLLGGVRGKHVTSIERS